MLNQMKNMGIKQKDLPVLEKYETQYLFYYFTSGKLVVFNKEKQIRITELVDTINIEDINPLQANRKQFIGLNQSLEKRKSK
ncbi:unnamed protein product (macronuclear) [Paramecium tetraurelia]|uniref:Uncharacterized protein n=1 Tax=Paramecium tetraurelia TaxID=5888 RepID=A0DCW6_PARTE|nr:uncharacterized protein GSPATT00015742001 [Paramecium tetraurelia]CAK80883.1 unnamed protein product [Paramecium tetraurelia]|eukprot:XP_001448280.1 hypothetical protein (macronuclear) [Paramecium tetraurelia strain d4-2]